MWKYIASQLGYLISLFLTALNITMGSRSAGRTVVHKPQDLWFDSSLSWLHVQVCLDITVNIFLSNFGITRW